MYHYKLLFNWEKNFLFMYVYDYNFLGLMQVKGTIQTRMSTSNFKRNAALELRYLIQNYSIWDTKLTNLVDEILPYFSFISNFFFLKWANICKFYWLENSTLLKNEESKKKGLFTLEI